LEDHATEGQLDEAQPLAARLEAMAEELMQLAVWLSLDALREQAKSASESRQIPRP
jgi:hypothetical protein